MTDDRERLYIVHEVAQQYRVHTDTIRRWLAKGVATPMKMARTAPAGARASA
jgi:hypothetical protein